MGGRARTGRVKELILELYNRPLNRRSKNSIKRKVEESLIRDRHAKKEEMRRVFLMMDI